MKMNLFALLLLLSAIFIEYNHYKITTLSKNAIFEDVFMISVKETGLLLGTALSAEAGTVNVSMKWTNTSMMPLAIITEMRSSISNLECVRKKIAVNNLN